MTKAPSDDWLSGEVEKQKRRDAEEMEQGVVVVEDDPEEVIGDDGEPKWMPGDPDDGPIVVPPTPTPEAHRAFGVEQARKSLLEAWELIAVGIDWLEAVGHRPEVTAKVVEVAGDLSHVVKLIEEWEGIER